MELTSPFTSGFQAVTVKGEVALKLKMLFRVMVLPCEVTWVNLPTAYMVLPHCTSCRIIWSCEPVGTRCGVPGAGVGDTELAVTAAARVLEAAARADEPGPVMATAAVHAATVDRPYSGQRLNPRIYPSIQRIIAARAWREPCPNSGHSVHWVILGVICSKHTHELPFL